MEVIWDPTKNEKTSLSTTSVLKLQSMFLLTRTDWKDMICPTKTNQKKTDIKHSDLWEKFFLSCIQNAKTVTESFLQDWQTKRRGEYTMQMERREVQIGDQPTPEMLKEIEEAAKHPIKYTEESPELTAKELSEFKPYYMVNHNLYKPRKVQITIRIDADVLEAFKSEGSGYQTKINDALRSYVFG